MKLFKKRKKPMATKVSRDDVITDHLLKVNRELRDNSNLNIARNVERNRSAYGR